jgi:hypothetical protein
MFESTALITVSFWLAMAILGQSERRRMEAGRADSGPSTVLAESRPEYVMARFVPGDEDDALPADLPPTIASEIRSIDAMRREIEAGRPIERWQFDGVRARYQAVLKKGAGEPDIEAAIRVRVARLGQLEQAAKAAATIQTILVESHRRDRNVAALRRRLQSSTARRSRGYQAIGFMQPSNQKVEGQKLFVLIGKNGATVAFLRIPPGLDPDPMLAQKVGVRGVAHYNEDLQSRLITVRTLEPVESRR